METAIKKKLTDHAITTEEPQGPLMVWKGVRSAEEVEKMSDWVTNQKKKVADRKASK